ncbi:hypothetical protein D9756_008717 [Leucocoprinus leucothites]|uniref:Uncharacterized protein n=1 Tax=Leucocoprinus leucothites TaxID=201217 RepID=A0A8H5FVH2_9AGAR|nr:hypothetical protein D9756_008717 [Leucoagaricus leucothites]
MTEVIVNPTDIYINKCPSPLYRLLPLTSPRKLSFTSLSVQQEMDSTHDASPLAAPFIGFIVGTVLFGVTLLQAYQYYLRYPKDSVACKLKVLVVCALDSLHFILGANIVYEFLITNSGSVKTSTKNTWYVSTILFYNSYFVFAYKRPFSYRSLKALAATQATLIVLVQL